MANSQKEIKLLLQVSVNNDFERSNEEIIGDIKEDIFVRVAYSHNSLKDSIIPFFKRLSGINMFGYDSESNTNKILYEFVRFSLHSQFNIAYARQKLAALKWEFFAISSPERFSSSARNDFDVIKIARNMVLRFKRDEKISGKIEQDENNFITNYRD